jgi:excisionase family DNA binding protein
MPRLPTLTAGIVLNQKTVPVHVALTWDSVAELRRLLDQPPPADFEEWIGAAAAAKHLDCPKSRIYQLTSRRAIPFHKEGERLLFRRSMLDAWVRAGCPAGTPGRTGRPPQLLSRSERAAQ